MAEGEPREKIRLSPMGSADMGLEWDIDLSWEEDGAESISDYTERFSRMTGLIRMKYSGWPHLVMCIANGIDDFSFFGEEERKAMFSFGFGSHYSSEREFDSFLKDIKSNAGFFQYFWKKFRDGPEPDETGKFQIRSFRESKKLDKIAELLEEKQIDPYSLDYAGFVPESVEFEQPVHVLKSESVDIYVGQRWGAGTYLLRMNKEVTTGLIKKFLHHYSG